MGGTPEHRSVIDVLTDDHREVEDLFQQALHTSGGAARADRLVELGDQVQKAKRMAPTRPHPSAPDTPPLNKVVGPGAGLVDRTRDRLSQLSR